VSELLRNLGGGSPWMTRPELIEIVSGTVTLAAKDQRRVANFNIRVKLLRSGEAEKAKAATAVSSAAKPAAAASAGQGK
jgi:type IV pilus assembly protein PilN